MNAFLQGYMYKQAADPVGKGLDLTGDALQKLERSPQLQRYSKWQRQSPAMKPVRQGIGRVVTNLKQPVGYNLMHLQEVYDKVGPKGMLQAVQADKPAWDAEDTYGVKGAPIMEGLYKTRSPLYRAAFDLPPRNQEQASDIYRPVQGRPKTVEFNPEGATGAVERAKVDKELKDIQQGLKTTGRTSTMGGFSAREVDGKLQTDDPWDFSTQRSQEARKGTGYSSLYPRMRHRDPLEKNPERRQQVERILHHIRNIGDKAITNPVTVTQSIPAKSK
jgi:hypothetical protein